MKENKKTNKILSLLIKTWENNESDIFDHKSDVINGNEDYIFERSFLVRTKDNKYNKLNQQIYIEDEDDLIFGISIGNKDTYTLINPIQKKLEYTEENINYINNKIWYVIKPEDSKDDSNCNEEYYLNKNDIIRIGRLKFVVQEIYLKPRDNENNKNNINDAPKVGPKTYNISDLNKNKDPVFDFVFKVDNIPTDDKKECDYCKYKDDLITEDGEDFLFHFCKCKDSIIIHYKCFKSYIINYNSREKKETIDSSPLPLSFEYTKDEKDNVVSITLKNFHCPKCFRPIPIRYKLPDSDKIYNIFDMEEPKNCDYMILESLENKEYEENYKSIHIIQLSEKNNIYIGRDNTKNNIYSKDISMSRDHAILKYNSKTGKITLQDRKSKFGTLVLVKSPIKIFNKKIYLQVGRTYIEASLINREDFENKNKEKKEIDNKPNN